MAISVLCALLGPFRPPPPHIPRTDGHSGAGEAAFEKSHREASRTIIKFWNTHHRCLLSQNWPATSLSPTQECVKYVLIRAPSLTAIGVPLTIMEDRIIQELKRSLSSWQSPHQRCDMELHRVCLPLECLPFILSCVWLIWVLTTLVTHMWMCDMWLFSWFFYLMVCIKSCIYNGEAKSMTSRPPGNPFKVNMTIDQLGTCADHWIIGDGVFIIKCASYRCFFFHDSLRRIVSVRMRVVVPRAHFV